MSNFKNAKLKEQLRKADVLRSGCDYLRLNFKNPIPFFDRILEQINTTNTNFVNIDGLTYEKLFLSSWPCLKVSTVSQEQAIPIFLFNLFWNWFSKNWYWRLDFYGMFFRMFELGELLGDPIARVKWFLQDKTSENPLVTRYDFCYDLFYKNKTPLPKRQKFFKKDLLTWDEKINKKTKHYEIWAWNTRESWSLGSKSNKRYVIRMYDKVLDVSSKGKQWFYWDYFWYESVHRFEVQFGSHFCKPHTLEYLDVLVSKINVFFDVKQDFYDGLMFYQYNSSYDINDFNRLFFTKTFIGKAKKFINSGINPYMVLFDYFKDNEARYIHFPMCLEFMKATQKEIKIKDYKCVFM